jgi:hypothetical protein
MSRLAHLQGLQVGEFGCVGDDEVGPGNEDLLALGGGQVGPPAIGEGPAGGQDGTVDVHA